MITKAQLEAQYKYDKNNTQQIVLKLNKKNDADILARLTETKNKQGYIKGLIRKDMRKESDVLDIESIRDLLLPVAIKYQIKALSIFGSYARKEATISSDVDIIIDGGNYKGLFEYVSLVNEMKNALGRNVDVITEKSLMQHNSRAQEYFRENVERDRIRLI